MTATPSWFTKAVSRPAESRFVDVGGAAIHYLSWNPADTHKPGLLFAHGFRAHARWWSFVAPFFLSRFRVVALDFAGMGDSAARERYESLDFSRAIVGVLEHAGLGRATLVGHSFGGGRVARACVDFPDCVERAVIVDSTMPLPQNDGRRPPALELRPKKIYATLATARERFRLVPEQNCAAPYVLDYVGLHSLQEVPGGWTWKFDENFLPRQINDSQDWSESVLSRIQVPVTFIYGDQSRVVSRELAHAIVGYLPHGRGPIAIPQSHHHVMLDQPLALVSALKAILY